MLVTMDPPVCRAPELPVANRLAQLAVRLFLRAPGART